MPAAPAPVRVLVVEDNPADARLAEWTLAHEPDGPYLTVRAGRLDAAVSALEGGPFEVVLLDRGLPDAEGMEGVRRLRAAAPATAVVLLSGADDPALSRAVLEAGAQDHLRKGLFEPGRLGRAVREALRRQRVEEALRVDGPDAGLGDDLEESGVAGAVLGRDGAPVRTNSRYRDLEAQAGPELRTALREALARLDRGPTLPPASVRSTRSTAFPVEEGPAFPSGVVRQVPRRDDWWGVVWLWEARPPGSSAPSAHPSAPIPAGTLLDPAAWRQLEELAGRDPEFLPALVAAFRAETARLSAALEAGRASGDGPALRRTAHQLKSVLAQVGAREAAALSAEVEAGAGGPGEVAQRVDQLLRELPAVRAAVDRALGSA